MVTEYVDPQKIQKRPSNDGELVPHFWEVLDGSLSTGSP